MTVSFKNERARAELMRARIGETDARIRLLDGELDQAVNEHQAATTPLHVELDAIDQRTVDAMVAGSQPDDADAVRRKTLRRKIEDATATLEATRDDVKRRQEILQTEREQIRDSMPNLGVIEANAYRAGDPSRVARHEGLLLAIHAVGQVASQINDQYSKTIQEAESAKKRIERCKGESDSHDTYAARLPKWENAVSVISKIAADLRAEADALRTAIIEAD